MAHKHAGTAIAWQLMALGLRLVLVCTLLLALVMWTRAMGLYWTLTASLPRGVYQRTYAPLVRGTLVAFCLPLPQAVFGWQRGYLARVPDLPLLRECPAGYQPLLKPIAAMAGDIIDLTPERVSVNGEPIAQSQTQEHDRAGRLLPHLPWGRYQLTAVIVFAGIAWAFTDHQIGARRVFAGAMGGALAINAPDVMTALGWTGALF